MCIFMYSIMRLSINFLAFPSVYEVITYNYLRASVGLSSELNRNVVKCVGGCCGKLHANLNVQSAMFNFVVHGLSKTTRFVVLVQLLFGCLGI